jgi:hypothetical protein
MMSENIVDANLESVPETIAKVVEPQTQPAGITETKPVYFTDGELLPWKGLWFRVNLREINGEKLIVLNKLKPTAAAQKRDDRSARWLKTHPNSTRSATVKLRKALRGISSAFMPSAAS